MQYGLEEAAFLPASSRGARCDRQLSRVSAPDILTNRIGGTAPVLVNHQNSGGSKRRDRSPSTVAVGSIRTRELYQLTVNSALRVYAMASRRHMDLEKPVDYLAEELDLERSDYIGKVGQSVAGPRDYRQASAPFCLPLSSNPDGERSRT